MSTAGFAFESFSTSVRAPEDLDRPAYWFLYKGGDLLVRRDGDSVHLPFARDLGSLGLTAGEPHFLGTDHGWACLAAELGTDVNAPDGWAFEGLRALFGSISDGFFSVAARASEILEWDRTHRFCGRCGTATTHNAQERARECPACGLLSYPRISPAVIVAVVRDRRLLLARARRFPPGFHSVLAGFVESGESLEECVHREVREETGVHATEVRYFASQPWPFPSSLMLGFHAAGSRAAAVQLDGELEDARWFSAAEIGATAPRLLPPPYSIARRLIGAWYTRATGSALAAPP